MGFFDSGVEKAVARQQGAIEEEARKAGCLVAENSGFTQIDLAWTVGIRPAAAGKVHLVMKNGRYGGVTTYGIGVGVFLRLCAAVRNIARNKAFQGEKPFVEPSAFAGIFDAILVANGEAR